LEQCVTAHPNSLANVNWSIWITKKMLVLHMLLAPSPYRSVVTTTPPSFHCYCDGWLPPNLHRHHGVLQCSRQSFWALSPHFRCSCHVIWLREHTTSQSSRPHCPPYPTHPLSHCKQQDCQDSRNSLGTVLSETVTTVLLSGAPTVACLYQLAHSRTARTISSQSRDIHLFPINNPSLDTDIRHRNRHCGGMSKKTRPPTKLQIPASVTTLPCRMLIC